MYFLYEMLGMGIAMKDIEKRDLHEEMLLSGQDWFICKDSDGDISCTDQWIPATVPGNIQADLESAHRLKPLWYGMGDPALVNVARTNWIYSKEFNAPLTMKDKHIKLVFDGIDYTSEIWLNGIKIGKHEGMFQKFGFDVTDIVKFNEKNRLIVKIMKMPEELLPYILGSDGKLSGDGTPYFFVEANNKTRQVLKGLKSPANFSYDWGTNIWTLGIWKDVRLEASGPAKIQWVQVKSKLGDGFQSASVHVKLEVDSKEAYEVSAAFKIAGNGKEITASVPVTLKKGINFVNAQLTVENPALWWPNGYGEQPMYELQSCLVAAKNDCIHDSKNTRFGIRDIRWEQVEGAPEDFSNPFRLILNGTPIRTMGSNLVAPDLLYGRIGDRGAHYIRMAKECNMNTLRQHGGQVIFPEKMYDAADEMGIMLLVDFPIANCVPESDPEFLANFEETLRNIVKQLRNHPSIIEWSGGNELDWYFKKDADHTALQVQRKVVSEGDDRLFRPTCPIAGSRHAPWDYNPKFHYKQFNMDIKDNFGIIPMMRYGEFGCQTPANLEVWHRDIPPESQWPINEDDPVLIRKNAVNAVFAKDFWLAKGVIDELFGEQENLEMLIKSGQFIGAEGVRYMMDALRAKGKALGGFTNWDYNEPWPNGAGSFMIDYNGRPLMMYYFVKQALEPLSLQLKYDSILYDIFAGTEIELLLVSDAPDEVSGLKWSWIGRDRRGEIFGQSLGTASIKPHETVQLQKIKINPPVKTLLGPVIIELYLYNEDGEKISERVHVFGAEGARGPLNGLVKTNRKDNDYGVPFVTTAITGGPLASTVIRLLSSRSYIAGDMERLELEIKNDGNMTALFCEIHPILEYRTDLYIDNNFAFIPPREIRKITVSAPLRNMEGLSLLQTGWNMNCWNAESIKLDPSEDVILSMGRRDSMCREFSGYFENKAEISSGAVYKGKRIEAAAVSHVMQDTITFCFDVKEEQLMKRSRLRIHTCDQHSEDETELEIKINEAVYQNKLQKGLGAQNTNPAQLAFPETVTVELSADLLKPGTNTVEITVKNDGWFTWDALDMVIIE